ncbi:MAG TPA: hypothetical protein VD929_06215 [Caulobacteraceae bacterium]|nr:hypothetical protein [Caulobacteraceae bacterium]
MTLRGFPSVAALATAAACAASPAWAQQLGQAQGVDVPLWRVLGALAVCLSLAVGAAVLLRRRLVQGGALPRLGPGLPRLLDLRTDQTDARRLELLETVRLSHQTDVCLLRCDGREFILSTSPQGAILVAAPPTVATRKSVK